MGPSRDSGRARARVIAVLLIGLLAFGAAPQVGAEEELKEAREELRETKAQIRARAQRMRELQRDLNRLATNIFRNEALIRQADERMKQLEFKVAVLEAQTARLQGLLNERNREAYIQGPGVPTIYLLTATSAVEFVDRLAFLSELNRRDTELAKRVGEHTERVSFAHAEIRRLQRDREVALATIEAQNAEMRRKLARSKDLFALLQVRKQDSIDTIRKYRPFLVCPMGGPYAIADNFGILHVHKEKHDEVHRHIHQGNDIAAAAGTPILAPFDGTAVTSRNEMGGMAVKVFGEYGYVYNAHLSRYGNLGWVKAGDVIGYVGATGNASGPHNHFEWHPGNGPAVDPYGFLLTVC
jgi:murein DD-endopeptidase MepM/ murein hydrolase activator NlpD